MLQSVQVINEYDNVPGISNNKSYQKPLIRNQPNDNASGVTEEVAHLNRYGVEYSSISKPPKSY